MDTVFVNGTVGSGKSTLVDALSDSETVPHAVIDLDEIRRLSPAPTDDRFNHELELQNLRGMAANYRRAGARRFLLAGVIEEPAEISRYVDALDSNGMFIVRLVAQPDALESRLRHRHADDPVGLRWHRARVAELAAILTDAALDDLVLDSTELTATELARIVRREVGWDPAD